MYKVYKNQETKQAQTNSGKVAKTTHKIKLTPNKMFGRTFVWVLFFSSIAINVFNIYQRFSPALEQRFIAVGVLNFLIQLPAFSFLAFLFRVSALSFGILLIWGAKKYKLAMNPVWWLLFGCCVYFFFAGLMLVINTLPFVLALFIVGFLQYLEILFWEAPRKSIKLWLPVVAAYIFEFWLQYDVLPFHRDYETFWQMSSALFTSLTFDWGGFMPMQIITAAVGIFGVEFGERFLKIVEKF